MEINGDEVLRAASGRATLDSELLGVLNDLVDDDGETLRDLVEAFVEDGPDRLREIRKGIDERDPGLVRRAAHTLKSNGLTFGAVDFADACRRLEDAAREGALDDETLATRVEVEWQRALPAIQELAG
jgi:HPt (histidine-containing phosphotransfer) domain-containing protein